MRLDGLWISHEKGRGILMLCDPRLVARPYGRRILRSLPPMKLTRRLADVEDFFRDYVADERVKLA